VAIAGCDRTVPCYMSVGTPTNVTANFLARTHSTNLTQSVYVRLNNVNTFTAVSPNPCESTWCPVLTSTEASYSAVVTLPLNIAIRTRGWLHWEIFNEKMEKVICYEVIIETRVAVKSWWSRIRDINRMGDIPVEV